MDGDLMALPEVRRHNGNAAPGRPMENYLAQYNYCQIALFQDINEKVLIERACHGIFYEVLHQPITDPYLAVGMCRCLRDPCGADGRELFSDPGGYRCLHARRYHQGAERHL